MMIKTETIGKKFRVSIGARPPEPGRAVLARVNQIWEAENARRDEPLFNGRLFSIGTTSDQAVTGYFAEYKWFIAQRRDPSLFQQLKVRPLAITGVLSCDDGIVIGRRAAHVEQDAEAWELVPSGGVDGSAVGADGAVDVIKTLETELAEETGISATALQLPLEPFVMVEDQHSHVTDIGILAPFSMTAIELMAKFEALENREYQALDIIPFDRLKHGGAPHLTAVSRAILGGVKWRMSGKPC